MHPSEIPNFEKRFDQEHQGLADEILGPLRQPEALPPPVAHRAELDRR
jgi:hypothetical protein